jgi:hypothetical protein
MGEFEYKKLTLAEINTSLEIEKRASAAIS